MNLRISRTGSYYDLLKFALWYKRPDSSTIKHLSKVGVLELNFCHKDIFNVIANLRFCFSR